MITLTSEDKWSGGGTVLALGTFDGVHIGHRSLLERAVLRAREMGLSSVACGFSAHPLLLLKGEAPLELIPGADKAPFIEEIGLDALLLRPFDRAFSELTAQEYVGLLARTLKPAHIVVGFNHRYGKGGQGTPDTLKAAGEELGFTVDVMQPVRIKGELVSSTAIRAALAQGDIDKANRMLGKPFSLEGVVVKGKQIGRTLSFPTANMQMPHRRAVPKYGVYTALAETDGLFARAVVNVGKHPTLPEGEPSIEAHLLDIHPDLYGKRLSLQFLHRLRDEKKFKSPQALREQVLKDIEDTRAFFRDAGSARGI